MKKSILNTDWNTLHQAIDIIHCVSDENDYAMYNVSIDANRVVIFDCVNNIELVVNKDGATTLQMAQIAIDEFITNYEPNLLVGTKVFSLDLYSVLIVPSSDEERYFEDAKDFHDAVAIAIEKDCPSFSVHSFKTDDERKSFIRGYNSAIGYNGDGYFITNSK